MSDDKPVPAHIAAVRAWVDARYELMWPQIANDIVKAHLARKRNGFQPGHKFHERKDTTHDDDQLGKTGG